MEKQLFSAVGSFGPWQGTLFATFFYANTVGIWQNFAMTFLAPNVPFRCVRPEAPASDGWPGQCSVRPDNTTGEVPCLDWEYDNSSYPDTLVSEWDLVCDREWLISFSKSVYMIGFMASVFVFGQLSDRIGRRPTIFLCYMIVCISLVLSLFSTSIAFFLVCRFLQAFGRTGVTTTGYVLMMELVGPRHRTRVGIWIQVGWSFGMSLLALIGYFFRDWFWFQVTIALPILPLGVAFLFLLPESPRWLLMQGKMDRLEKLILTAARRNGRKVSADALEQITKAKLVDGDGRGNLLDLFRTPRMRVRTLNMMYQWIVNAFLYYAMSFNTNDLSGDPYLNFLVLGLLELPSYALLYPAARRFGRQRTLVTLMLAAGTACLALAFTPQGWLGTTLSQFGKFCVTASFGLLYLYTGEMFPTVVRSSALGSCSTVARIGSIVAPFSREMGRASHSSVPNVLNCVLAVSSGLFALRLPETAGRTLPDTLREGEAFEKHPSPSSSSAGVGRTRS